jgi:phosphoenolpyruvate carboxylase
MVISKAEMTLAKVDIQMAEHYVQELQKPKIKSAANVSLSKLPMNTISPAT